MAQRCQTQKSCARPALVNCWRRTTAQLFCCPASQTAKEHDRGSRTCKGPGDKAKGAIKEGAGKLSGDKDMETEGKIDKASTHNAAGNVKNAARDAAEAVKK
jgi:uncharacterized protein YjbJ (UPF0337 family)